MKVLSLELITTLSATHSMWYQHIENFMSFVRGVWFNRPSWMMLLLLRCRFPVCSQTRLPLMNKPLHIDGSIGFFVFVDGRVIVTWYHFTVGKYGKRVQLLLCFILYTVGESAFRLPFLGYDRPQNQNTELPE